MALLAGALGTGVATGACDRHLNDRRPGGPHAETVRSFGCERGARAFVHGTGDAAALRLFRVGTPAPALSGPMLGVRERGGRLEASVAGTPVHLEPVGRYGLTEHLTIGTLSCWR